MWSVLAFLKVVKNIRFVFYLSSFLFDFGKFLEVPEILKNPRKITNPITI
tara:strand:+ start:809 stop:958 length:150 start_codon:yes stop_codon:yes gene_type:complete